MSDSRGSSFKSIVSVLKRALQLNVAYGYPRPTGGVQSAVLAVLKIDRAGPDLFSSVSILVIQRAERDGDRHSGQMAFPGGAVEKRDASLQDAALRECEEEVGLKRAQLTIIDELPSLGTPSGFQIHPFVALLEGTSDVHLDPLEVASAHWISLSEFLNKECYSSEFREVGGKKYPIHVYQLRGHRIWGATAAMIFNLIERIQILSGEEYGLFLGPVVLCAESDSSEACAAKALSWAGCDASLAVLKRQGRMPVWPKGFVGSITHKGGKTVAVAASVRSHSAIGIDVEEVFSSKVEGEVRDTVASSRELVLVEVLGWTSREALTLIFSAKESVYKAVSLRLGLDLGFNDIEIEAIDAREQNFRYRVKSEAGSGRFQKSGSLIRTSAEIFSAEFEPS